MDKDPDLKEIGGTLTLKVDNVTYTDLLKKYEIFVPNYDDNNTIELNAEGKSEYTVTSQKILKLILQIGALESDKVKVNYTFEKSKPVFASKIKITNNKSKDNLISISGVNNTYGKGLK